MRLAWVLLLGLLLLRPAAVASAQPIEVPLGMAQRDPRSADRQSGRQQGVNASGTGLKNVDTAVVVGIRLYVRF